MINKLLLSCLNRNKRLIIPTLGAFIRRKIEGVGETITFVPFLNKDDSEMLLHAIESWVGVGEDDARVILEQYIDAIKESLNERGQYVIESLGALRYDANGIIYLGKEIEKVSEEVIPAAKPVSEPAPNTIPEPVVAPTPEPVVVSTPEPVAVPVVEAPVAPEPTPMPEPAAAPIEPVVAPVEPVAPVAAPFEPKPEVVENFDVTSYYAQQSEQTATPATPTTGVYQRAESHAPQSSSGAVSYYDRREQPTVVSAPKESVSETNEPQVTREGYQPSQPKPARSKYSNIYGDSSAAGEPKEEHQRVKVGATGHGREQQHSRSRVDGAQSGVSQQMRRKKHQPSRGGVTKKKKNDIVLWCAIAAVILAVVVLIYGSIYGREQSLDSQSLIENISSPTVAPNSVEAEAQPQGN